MISGSLRKLVLRTTDLLLPGIYAWGVTVAWPAFGRVSPPLVRGLALLALLVLSVGSALAVYRPRFARALGVYAFVALCTAVFALLPPRAGSARLDPVQGIAGTLGWALFALGWAGDGSTGWGSSYLSPASPSSAGDGRAQGLIPRSRPSPLALLLVVVGGLSAVLVLGAAWLVQGRNRALFAHVSAVAAAVGLLVTVGDLAARHSRSRSEEPAGVRADEAQSLRVRLHSARRWMLALLAVVLLGAAYALAR